MTSSPERITLSPRAIVHQEGLFSLIALLGLMIRVDGLYHYLAPRLSWLLAIAFGMATGLAISLVLWLVRGIGPARELEDWLGDMMREWTVADALAVAVISGLAEEALVRALLQPLIGLVPAAILFGLLHIFPDRRLWFWPLRAMVIGLVIGALFERFGYPAAAAAHIAVNAVGMMRIVTSRAEEAETEA